MLYVKSQFNTYSCVGLVFLWHRWLMADVGFFFGKIRGVEDVGGGNFMDNLADS